MTLALEIGGVDNLFSENNWLEEKEEQRRNKIKVEEGKKNKAGDKKDKDDKNMVDIIIKFSMLIGSILDKLIYNIHIIFVKDPKALLCHHLWYNAYKGAPIKYDPVAVTRKKLLADWVGLVVAGENIITRGDEVIYLDLGIPREETF